MSVNFSLESGLNNPLPESRASFEKMKIVRENRFRPIPASEETALAEEPLILHRHSETQPNLAILVHGLGGTRYGTWRNFPRFLFEDFPKLDIGLYSYRTSWRRLKLTASIELEREAAVLADLIRDTRETYARVILIGHSMGGLLSKAAIKDLIDRGEMDTLDRVSGLFLIASPQAGSLWIPPFLTRFSKDLRALKPHGELVTAIAETFNDRVTFEMRPNATSKIVIPTWIVTASEDLWVSRLSSGLHLPSHRRKHVRGSHTQVVKPRARTEDTYQWVAGRIRQIIAEPADARPSPEAAPNINKLPQSLIDPQSQQQSPECKSDNPFVLAGPLGLSATTYIRRDCDMAFGKAIAENERILVTGPFEIGKSSLLEQTPSFLASDWLYFGDGLAEMRSENATLFISNFFRMFESQFGRLADWRELAAHIRRQRSVLLLDDLGEIEALAAKALLPRLHELVAACRESIRLVASLGSPIGRRLSLYEFLKLTDLGNPKYSRGWSTVALDAFTTTQAWELLDRLPPSVRRLIRVHWNDAPSVLYLDRNESNGVAPRNLQCLCSRLFDAHEAGCCEDDVVNLIRDEETYL